ncbi:MAG: helix-turn-helix domain-containing protein [Bacteroidales bacterium]|nr:helix-turn-helix domain-containing protein [Bacteroidales bacterium]
MLNFDNLGIILFILPVYQMMFYSVQLFTLRKGNGAPRRPLGFLMLLMLLYLIVNSSRYLGYADLYKYLYTLQLPMLLAVIPAYQLYLRAVSNARGRVFPKPPLVYFLPSVFMLMLNIAAFVNKGPGLAGFSLSAENFLSTNNNAALSFASLVFLLGNIGFVAMQLLFTSFHYFKMVRELKQIRETNSAYLPHFQTLWSHIILFSIVGFVLVSSLMNLATPAYNHLLSLVFNAGLLAMGGLAGYFSLKQDRLYTEVASVTTVEQKANKSGNMPEEPASKSENKHTEGLSSADASEIVSRLQQHLATDKPFLNSNLRAVDLAKSIGTTNQKLTYVVNNIMETNFYGIINKYRVLEAKELLRRPENQHFNIDAISEMVGFQSKSSFNGCFKKMTGCTPSEFRKYGGKR